MNPLPLRIKVDEDLPPVIAQRLCAEGYVASTVIEQGMGGWKDAALGQAVQAEGKFLVTADKGFADVRTHPPGSHVGVLLLRPDEDGIRPLLVLLEEILATYRLEALQGAIAVATRAAFAFVADRLLTFMLRDPSQKYTRYKTVTG